MYGNDTRKFTFVRSSLLLYTFDKRRSRFRTMAHEGRTFCSSTDFGIAAKVGWQADDG